MADLTTLKKILSVLPFLLFAVSAAQVSYAQADDEELPVYYTIDRGVTLFSVSDSTQPYLHLRFREPVKMVENGGNWSTVRTMDGANGQVPTSSLSNVWIRISKQNQTLYVYRGSALMAKYATDLGYNFFADKEQQGTAAEPDHWRTPEGEFYIVAKNPRSQYYRAFVLNYPNGEDAERGIEKGLISETEYNTIKRADNDFRMPPMNTRLGGYIEIHGDGTGRRSNWTHGCIAITNDQMDRLWDLVDLGTPVLIDS